MDKILNPEHFNAPHITYWDLPSGMGEKLEVGDTIVTKRGMDETEAKVIKIDSTNRCIYLSKSLPLDADEYVVKETATHTEAPFDAMQKAAASEKSNVLTGPLPDLKKMLIQISIEQGDCDE